MLKDLTLSFTAVFVHRLSPNIIYNLQFDFTKEFWIFFYLIKHFSISDIFLKIYHLANIKNNLEICLKSMNIILNVNVSL